MSDDTVMIAANDDTLDPLADEADSGTKNRAKVGSSRPSALLYTFGVGSVMDLPHFSVMPAGLDDWDRIWARRPTIPSIDEPRLLDVVRLHLGPQVTALRPFPWQPKTNMKSQEGSDIGVPARVFPQYMRCTGCQKLAPLHEFTYTNTHPFRPDLAIFEHSNCPGRGARGRGAGAKNGQTKTKKQVRPVTPARYLLTCPNGHLDEFPYDLWVHRGQQCDKAKHPDLKMRDNNVGQGTSTTIICMTCGKMRGMSEALGDAGKKKLPLCRGRHPHLNAFDSSCGSESTLIMMGASNLWFSSTQSVIVMPRSEAEDEASLADKLRSAFEPDKLTKYADLPDIFRDVIGDSIDVSGVTDEELTAAVKIALAPLPSEAERQEKLKKWDPVDLLVPEWNFLQKAPLMDHQEDPSGLMVTPTPKSDRLPEQISQVIAVNRMKKINAFLGFTRLDDMDRVEDVASRLVSMTLSGRPKWVPATEDRGEGIFLQLDEVAVEEWEAEIEASSLWEAHRQSHFRNYSRRMSATGKVGDPDERFPSPRYWLIHTLSHALIREMAMSCGYPAASLSERLYAWKGDAQRKPAAGMLICTTSSDSAGTLGGLVALSAPDRLEMLVNRALRRACRCSSDPVCAQRTPKDPEDFLHGAACHCCSFASETSCERSNRFLDRRFLVNLPSGDGDVVRGFFDVR